MTDVLIKNWCIPECCMDCDPDFAYAIKCEAYNENNDFTRQRAENCPLVEIKNSQDGDTISRDDAIEAVAQKWILRRVPKARMSTKVILVTTENLYRSYYQTFHQPDIPSAETHEIRTETHGVCSDLIRRADAIAFINSGISLDTDADREYATEMFKNIPSAEAVEVIHDTEWVAVRRDEYEDFLASAEANPTVIRSKTLMPTKDFKEWAKRVREENPNVIVIPCDAEVVSAEAENDSCDTCKYFETSHREYPCSDCTVGNSHYVSAEAVQGWIPCSERLPSMRTEVIYSFDGCVSTGYMIDRDFNGEKMELHWEDLESGATIEPIAWMPLPPSYRGE